MNLDPMLAVAAINVVAAALNLWNAVRNHRTAKANLRNAKLIAAARGLALPIAPLSPAIAEVVATANALMASPGPDVIEVESGWAQRSADDVNASFKCTVDRCDHG